MRRVLFYNFERGALPMTRGGAGEQRPNSLNGLTAAANHPADIALSKLKSKNGCSAARNFREHHVVGIFDQLPNDELEKFSHDEKITANPPSHNATKRQANSNFLRKSAQRLFRLPTSGLRRFPGGRFCAGWLRRRRRFFRARGCRYYGRFGRSFRGRAGDLLFVFLDQAANGVGRLRAFTDPIFGAIEFQRAVGTRLFRIVGADDFNEFPIARAAAIGHHHLVIRAILRSFSA